ncbi:ABC transporter ATP-binding protein [Megalodesulfovibrio paquesii]
MPTPAAPLFATRDLSKRFGKVLANQHISLEIHAGRIHALLGENGAGKSTLMSMLAGRTRPDKGTILHQGRPVAFASPAQAIALGVGMVYQRLMLVAPFTVAENLALSLPRLSVAAAAALTRELAARYGLQVDPQARIADLSMGERQRVEILKLLARDASLLILDEPTAVLTPAESERLFATLKALAAEGRAVIVITHKLEEVLAHADEISVLRRGRLVATGIAPSQVTNRGELARLMVGREVVLSVPGLGDDDESTADSSRPPLGEEVLRLEHATGNGFADVSLRLRRGEILAVVGVAGNGQERLAACLAGLERFGAGSVAVCGMAGPARDYRPPRNVLAYVPEDRHHVGSVAPLQLTENCLLTRDTEFIRKSGLLRLLGWLNRPAARKATARLIAERQIAAPSPEALAGSLSGGNLQKLILGRELGRHPRLLLVEQPTQGLDVQATRAVWQALLQARAEAGVLLVTGDLKEALSLADRVAVFFRGRVMDVLSLQNRQGEEGLHRIGLLMAGAHAAAGASA